MPAVLAARRRCRHPIPTGPPSLADTYKFCSPSRCSLLTGRLPVHVNTHNDPYTVPGAGIPLGMTTIAAKLQSAGCERVSV